MPKMEAVMIVGAKVGVEGEDEAEAMAAIENLIFDRFGEAE